MSVPTLNSSSVKEAAAAVGFDACGIAAAAPLTEEEWGYDEWLRNGYQADMAFMEQHRDMRRDPSLLVPGAQSVIVVSLQPSVSGIPTSRPSPVSIPSPSATSSGPVVLAWAG